MLAALFARIEAQREALVALTQELIRIPTVNPPGEAYRACARPSGGGCGAAASRSSTCAPRARPATATAIRAGNVVARREGRGPGACVHFNSHIDVVEPGDGWTVDPFGGVVEGRPGLRPRRLRHEGRPRRLDRRRSKRLIDSASASPGAIEISGTADEESGGYGGVAYLAERGCFSPARRPRHHPRAAQQGPHLPRPSRRLVGRDRDQGRASPTARCRSSATAPSATWARCWSAFEASSTRRSRAGTTAMPVVPPERAPVDAEHQLDPWRPARADRVTPACPRRWSPTPAAWSSTAAS